MSSNMSGDSIVVRFLLLVFLLVPCASQCKTCLRQSKANYFSSSSALSDGACGYGFMGPKMSGGYLAAGDSFIYNCGACFQIRCNKTKICRSKGVKVVLTDLKKGNNTGFMLSSHAFEAMARHGKAEKLKKLGTVDVEYKRIPCEYKHHNLSIRIEEGSHYPTNLTIKFLYQGGQTTILLVSVSKAGMEWLKMDMKQVNGPIWNISPAPEGPIKPWLLMADGFDTANVYLNVLPAGWKVGEIYDTGVQLYETGIDTQPCSTCDPGDWK